MTKKATAPRSHEATKGNWRLQAIRHASHFHVKIGTAAIGWILAGCASHFVNPWRDELSLREHPAALSVMTTPSVDAARAAAATPSNLQRSFAPDTLPPVAPAVTHGPLYFEDRHESTSYDDGEFAWTGMDYWYLFYGPGRWMANGLLFPVSVAATPPWVLMESDGAPGRRAFGERHDAARRTEPGADVPVTE